MILSGPYSLSPGKEIRIDTVLREMKGQSSQT